MDIGLLWFDNGSQRSLKEKIGKAVSHYLQRFGDKPTVCYMHPDTLDADFNSLKGVRLKTAMNVLPHHFWVGMETDPQPAQRRSNGNAASG